MMQNYKLLLNCQKMDLIIGRIHLFIGNQAPTTAHGILITKKR